MIMIYAAENMPKTPTINTNMHMLSFLFFTRWQYRTHLKKLSGRFEYIKPVLASVVMV